MAVDAAFECLPGADHEDLDGPDGLVEPLGDFLELLPAEVVPLDGLAGRLPQPQCANRQQVEHVLVGSLGLDRFLQLQAQLGPGDFLAFVDPPHVLVQDVACDADQPRPDVRGRVEPVQCPEGTEEGFLGEVLGVRAVQQPGAEIAVHGCVMSGIDLREGRTVLLFAHFGCQLFLSKGHCGVPRNYRSLNGRGPAKLRAGRCVGGSGGGMETAEDEYEQQEEPAPAGGRALECGVFLTPLWLWVG